VQTIPWKEVLPLIDQWLQEGHSWALITDSINAKYGTAVSSANVLYHYEHRGSGNEPYIIPARRRGKQKLSDADVQKAIHFANRTLGRKSTDPISIGEYDRVRKAGGRSSDIPSSIGIRRKYGTWANACEVVGVNTNQPRRGGYDGLTIPDAIVWLSHWLRDLRNGPGSPKATAGSYRIWVRENPSAPSYDALRSLAMWGDLLEDAADFESSTDVLPKPKPVTAGPGKHRSQLLEIS